MGLGAQLFFRGPESMHHVAQEQSALDEGRRQRKKMMKQEFFLDGGLCTPFFLNG